METSGLIAIGEVIKAQGIKGELKVIPLTDNLERFGQIRRVFLQGPADDLKELYIQNYRLFRQYVILKFEGIDDLTAAAALGRGYLLIPRAERPSLPAGRYYYDEIIGLKVFTVSGEFLGEVEQILATGANDVYCVRKLSRQVLVPALKSVVRQINLEEGRMEVDLPAGLMEEQT
ncbi:MAG TPA: ribosome maturation factor RimM [Bacillota bacterium]